MKTTGFTAVPYETEVVGRAIIGAAIEVHRLLGPGFLERIYQDALSFELHKRGVAFQREAAISVRYKDLLIAGQRIDLIVAERVVVELKTVMRFEPIHEAIVMSYLRSTELRLGLLMNFHARLMKDGIKRIVR